MALITENGSGLSTAESYVSVASADTRLAALGLTNWTTLSTAEKEQALRRATARMEQAYRSRWKGERKTTAQALAWPRYGVVIDGYVTVESDVVPTDVANACAELAFKAAAGDLNADLGRATIREKVGPIETEYSASSPQTVRYRALDMALAPYLCGSSAMAMLVRV